MKRRRTVEFRIVGKEGCCDPFVLKCWIKLLIHFVERTKIMNLPVNYNKEDRFSGFALLDPYDVFKILGFTDNYELSLGLKQLRDWFLFQLNKNCSDCNSFSLKSFWSNLARSVAQYQIHSLIEKYDVTEKYNDDYVYSKKFDF
jgi:hypothetical protein